MKITVEDLKQGKIYYLDYGSNTQIVGRFKEKMGLKLIFFDYLHYWNGHEQFHQNYPYCVTGGIENIRIASKSEKYNLINHEISNDCI